PATTFRLNLPCKDCHQPVSDAETNAYQLVAGILYGWCNECFKRQQALSEAIRAAFPICGAIKDRGCARELINREFEQRLAAHAPWLKKYALVTVIGRRAIESFEKLVLITNRCASP